MTLDKNQNINKKTLPKVASSRNSRLEVVDSKLVPPIHFDWLRVDSVTTGLKLGQSQEIKYLQQSIFTIEVYKLD